MVRLRNALLTICCLLDVMLHSQGYFLSMTSQTKTYSLMTGETAVLFCDFHAEHYNLFDYPVLWLKTQHHETTQINIMSNVNEPFMQTGRFQPSFQEDAPLYRLELDILSVSPEDSGNYTCEVRGPQSTILGHVTHNLFVRAPINGLYLEAENYTMGPGPTDDARRGQADDGDDDREKLARDIPDVNIRHGDHKNGRQFSLTPSSPRFLTLIEDTLNSIRCVAEGGYPAPQLQVKLGKRNITDHFRLRTRPKMSGLKGLRIITYTTELQTESFIPRKDDDGKKLKCLASVPDMEPNVTSMKLEVLYAPKITCQSNAVYEMERNAVLTCHVEYKPALTALFWIVDANGTTMAAGDIDNELWTLIFERAENYVEAQLFIRFARPEMFRTYTLVAENSVAANSRNVDLIKELRTTPPAPYELTAKSQSSVKQGRNIGYSYHADSGGDGTAHTRRTLLLAITVSLLHYAIAKARL